MHKWKIMFYWLFYLFVAPVKQFPNSLGGYQNSLIARYKIVPMKSSEGYKLILKITYGAMKCVEVLLMGTSGLQDSTVLKQISRTR